MIRWLQKNGYGTERGRRLISLALTVCVLLFFALFCEVSFYDNDDLNIAWALAGYRSGMPSFSHPFINCITGALVSLLYTLLPAFPWWLAVQWAAMAAGVYAAFLSVLRIGARRGAPFLLSLVLCGLLTAALYAYPLVSVTFTLSSAVAGAGAVALLLSMGAAPMDGGDAIKAQRRCYAGSVALLTTSFLIRQSAGLCLACFWFGAAAYRLLGAWLQRKKAPGTDAHALRRCLTAVGIAALSILALTAVNAWGREHLNPDGYMTFENARADYMDYPHDSIAASPALFEAEGWDGTLYGLVERWFFMDERVNAETLSAIFDGSAYRALSLSERLAAVPFALQKLFRSYAVARAAFFATALLLMALVVQYALHRGNPLPFLAGLALTAGAAVLLCYVVSAGRTNLRTLLTVLAPLELALTLLSLALYAPGKRRRGVLPACLVALALLPGLISFREVLHIKVAEQVALSRSVSDYALAHPENVYIRDVYVANNFDALVTYPDEKPTNLIDWGGCDMYTAARERQLAVNGLKSPYADVFFESNVYYIGEEDGECLALLAAYMKGTRGAAGYEVADTLDGGIAVVQFHPGAEVGE